MGERDTEDRILDAAHAVFLRRGTAGARMREVAEEAGVNKALLHYYFRSKEQLAQAVFMRALQSLLPEVFRTLESDLEIERKVRRIVELEVDTLLANPFLAGYVLGELTHHPERARSTFESAAGVRLGELGTRVLEALGPQLEEEVKAGRMREIAPEEFVMNLVALTIFPFAGRPLFSAMLGLDDPEFQEMMQRRKERLPEFFLNALRP